MQKTFLFGSIVTVALVTLLSIRFQLSDASADTVPDLAVATSTDTLGAATLVPMISAEITIATTTTQALTTVASASTAEAAVPVKKTVRQAEESSNVPRVGITQTTVPHVEAAPKKVIGTADQYPERLIIPSLNIDVPIKPVGVNAKGEMDVPSGDSSNVGWYEAGTMPGNIGSAVLDAHVFAAFRSLRYLKVGEDIFVLTKGGTKLRFRVEDSRIYALSELTSPMLFGRKDARRLNLITCAGEYVTSMGTYDHRLVDYAVFVDEE